MYAAHWVVLGGWILGWILLWRVPRLPRSAGGASPEPVTVVVPARNEAARLPRLLEALAPGLAPGETILVVDDHSTDGTAEVARRHPGVTVLPAPALPEGWTGKAWACHTGASAAPEGILAFVDADVRITAQALRNAVAARREMGGLVSIWPRHEVVRPYEHLSALFNVTSFMGIGAGSALPPRQMRAALGPVLVTSTGDYRQAGGHEAVRTDVVEDLAIGRRYAEAGLPVHVYGGGRDITFRMYGEGLAGLVRGWVKSFGRGAIVISPLRAVGIFLWVACSFGAWMWAGGVPHPAALVLTALYAVQMGVMFRQVGNFGPVNGLLYPVHATFFAAVFFFGLFKTHVWGDVSWRGRSYDTKSKQATPPPPLPPPPLPPPPVPPQTTPP